jgi:hypothetical protein
MNLALGVWLVVALFILAYGEAGVAANASAAV